jgi:hypothetical protein
MLPAQKRDDIRLLAMEPATEGRSATETGAPSESMPWAPIQVWDTTGTLWTLRS